MLTINSLHRRQTRPVQQKPAPAPAESQGHAHAPKPGPPETDIAKTPAGEKPSVKDQAVARAARENSGVSDMQRAQALATQTAAAANPNNVTVLTRSGLNNAAVAPPANEDTVRPPVASGEPPAAHAPHDDRDRPPPSRDEMLKSGLAPFAGKTVPTAKEIEGRLEKTKAWAELSPQDQAQTRTQLAKPGDEGRLIRAQTDAALNQPGFEKMSGAEQTQRLEPAVFPPLPPSSQHVLSDVKGTAAYKSLDAKTQANIEKAFAPGNPLKDPLTQVVAQQQRKAEDAATVTENVQQLARIANTLASDKLHPESKEILAGTMLDDRVPFGVSKAMSTVAGSDRVKAMAPLAQAEALLRAESDIQPAFGDPHQHEAKTQQPPVSSEALATSLQKDSAYAALDAPSRSALDRLTQGDNPIAQNARQRVSDLMKSETYKNGDAATRQAILKNVQHLGGLPEGVNNVTPSEGPRGQARVTGSKDVTARFEQSEGPATEHAIEIKRGDRTFNVNVQMPKETVPGRITPTLDQVKNALTRLPDDQLNSLQAVVVNPDGEPGNGMSTQGDDGRVQISPAHDKREAQSRFEPGAMSEVLNHEVGHLQSLTPWGQDQNAPEWKAWNAARQGDGLSPSDYAKQNAPEDFAETYALYRSSQNRPQEHAEYRRMFPGRFAAIDKLMGRAR